jgi:mRNA-degrading endonuclease toxin of MazEF toxin-antitoxin module
LLLSRKDSYTYLTKYIAVEITTTIRNIPVEVAFGKRDGLEKTCVANFDSVRTVSRDWLVERISALPARRIPEVKRALGYALGWEELIDLGDA